MSVRLLTKWYGIHKLIETMAALQLELARLASDPHNRRPGRNLIRRVELKMADVMAALQWFEYHNRLDVDVDRLETALETFDAWHAKAVMHIPRQTHMHGVIAVDLDSLPAIVSNDKEPETLPSTQSEVEAYGRG